MATPAAVGPSTEAAALGHGASLAALTLAAIGVVYGYIGTSPRPITPSFIGSIPSQG